MERSQTSPVAAMPFACRRENLPAKRRGCHSFLLASSSALRYPENRSGLRISSGFPTAAVIAGRLSLPPAAAARNSPGGARKRPPSSPAARELLPPGGEAIKPSPCGGRWLPEGQTDEGPTTDQPSSVACGDSFPQRGKPIWSARSTAPVAAMPFACRRENLPAKRRGCHSFLLASSAPGGARKRPPHQSASLTASALRCPENRSGVRFPPVFRPLRKFRFCCIRPRRRKSAIPPKGEACKERSINGHPHQSASLTASPQRGKPTRYVFLI